MKRTIWFDMDGTIADFYSVDNWLEKILNEDTSPYAEAKPLFDSDEMDYLISLLRKAGYDIGIISYAPHDCTLSMLFNTMAVKRDWLDRYFPYASKIHITTKATPKSTYYNEGDVLVDDEIANIIDWMDKGGDAVQNFKALYTFVA